MVAQRNKVLRKISLPIIIGKSIKKILADSGGKLPELLIYGIAHSCSIKSGETAPIVSFVGQFFANYNNKNFESTRLYLPAVAQDEMYKALKEQKKLNFAYTIKVKASDANKFGYVAEVVTVIKPHAVDPVKYLEKELLPKNKQTKIRRARA